jgi:hypothetical protein
VEGLQNDIGEDLEFVAAVIAGSVHNKISSSEYFFAKVQTIP